MEKLPEAPTLLSLNELAIKTGLSYQFLRKMIVEEKHVSYMKVGRKYIVNYELFLQRLGNMEG
ncbi:DNA-binding protein [Dorea formicigenerans]|uniref:DNA-binding protein n=1 Tax=Dorea formicigenerans TaxID=39486 RepID=A0A412KC37_9FIRM|nr:DNA-binding protein [Dorea formicigenerans]